MAPGRSPRSRPNEENVADRARAVSRRAAPRRSSRRGRAHDKPRAMQPPATCQAGSGHRCGRPDGPLGKAWLLRAACPVPAPRRAGSGMLSRKSASRHACRSRARRRVGGFGRRGRAAPAPIPAAGPGAVAIAVPDLRTVSGSAGPRPMLRRRAAASWRPEPPRCWSPPRCGSRPRPFAPPCCGRESGALLSCRRSSAGMAWRISFSTARSLSTSSGETSATASPLAPARAVRPMRWT